MTDHRPRGGSLRPALGSVLARALLCVIAAVAVAPTGARAVTLSLQALPGATGLSQPVGIVDPGDASGRLFIVEQTGTIRIWRNGALVPAAFLTIPAANLACCGELGLLGL